MPQEDVLSLPVEVLTEAAGGADVAMTPLEIARLVAEVLRIRGAQKDPTQQLVDQQERVDRRQREAYRLAVENAEKERAAVRKVAGGELQATFIALAKAKALSPQDVLTAGYALFASADAMQYQAHCILHKDAAERVRSHNLYVASAVPNSESFLLTYGALLLTLPVPLLPAAEPFGPLNIQLLREYQQWLSSSPHAGGSGGPHFRPSVYSPVEDTGPQGGGALAVQPDGQGGWAVDVTHIEQAFDACWSQLQRVTEDVQKLQAGKLPAELKTIADALATGMEQMRLGLGRARGATFRGRGRGRGGRGRGGRAWGFQ